jgi:hypothetical protein
MAQVLLAHNRLSGPLLPAFLALPALNLDLGYNNLTGSIPTLAWQNPAMQHLLLPGNQMSGGLEASLAR